MSGIKLHMLYNNHTLYSSILWAAIFLENWFMWAPFKMLRIQAILRDPSFTRLTRYLFSFQALKGKKELWDFRVYLEDQAFQGLMVPEEIKGSKVIQKVQGQDHRDQRYTDHWNSYILSISKCDFKVSTKTRFSVARKRRDFYTFEQLCFFFFF